MAKLVASFEYSDSELLALAREAIAKLTAGAQEVYIGDERYRRADLKALQDLVGWLEARVGSADGLAVNLGRYKSR